MNDVMIYWLATSQREIHFIDAIISAYDGMAAVRRDFEIRDGRAMYKVFVARGMEEEFLDVMSRLRSRAQIDALVRDDDA